MKYCAVPLSNSQCEDLDYDGKLVINLEDYYARILNAVLYECDLYPGDEVIFRYLDNVYYITTFDCMDTAGNCQFIKTKMELSWSFHRSHPEYFMDEDNKEFADYNKFFPQNTLTIDNNQLTLEF